MIINLSKIDFGGVTGGKSKPEEVFDVQPTTAEQTITPTEGSVFSGGTVHAVTAAIDVNIASNNIKEGVTILGVAGSLKEEKPEESFNVQPTTAEQTITPREGYTFSGGTVHAVTSSIDSNIQPENIKEGVSILGVAGTLSGGSGGDTPDYRYMNGTIDRAGLKAIGWTDEDILTFEQNKAPHFPWQNDQYKVSDENKELYLLDDPNPSSYKTNPNITFVPKKNMESYFAKPSGFSRMYHIKGIPRFDTSNMTNASYLFEWCSNLTTVPQIDLSNATNVSALFYGCSNLTTVPQLDLSSATEVGSLFNGCSNLTAVPQLDLSSATSASYLFNGCTNLTAVPTLNTSNVQTMESLFSNCTNLKTVPALNTSNATSVESLFSNCTNLKTVPQLDLSNATNVGYLFNGCSSLITIPSLDTSKATKFNSMLSNCSSLTTVEGIDFSGLTENLAGLFGWSSNMRNLTRFIVNGKINVSIKDSYSIKALTAIDYDSVKSILAAADRTDNTNAKTLVFNRTMTDQNGELAALVASCTSKGWTISGLTLQ